MLALRPSRRNRAVRPAHAPTDKLKVLVGATNCRAWDPPQGHVPLAAPRTPLTQHALRLRRCWVCPKVR